MLLVGPPGSGRRHLAAAIHYGANPPSPERSGDDAGCRLDCSLLGADLLEEVAAAVARGRQSGEKTVPGTLLLHRVDEISTDVQVELAGLLVRRPLNWRLMATAAEPLAELARRGKFRDDLAAALSTIVIELPLAWPGGATTCRCWPSCFWRTCNAGGRGRSAALPPRPSICWTATLGRETSTSWPRWSPSRTGGRRGGKSTWPTCPSGSAWSARRPPARIVPKKPSCLNEYLGRVERELIRRALARAKGNKARAARLLGMTRPRLYRRMVQLGLE